MSARPFIVALGGTCASGSSTERALCIAAEAARAEGADVRLFDGPALTLLDHYTPGAAQRSAAVQELIEAVRTADGLIVASPGYHGGISGLVKNSLDHLEETASDPRPYLDGRPVGLIATGYGVQAAASTLGMLRTIVHALRGWPTPFGAAIQTSGGLFSESGCSDAVIVGQLSLIAEQVVGFARRETGSSRTPQAQAAL